MKVVFKNRKYLKGEKNVIGKRERSCVTGRSEYSCKRA